MNGAAGGTRTRKMSEGLSLPLCQFRHSRKSGARGRRRTCMQMGLSHPGMPIPSTRAEMVGRDGIEPPSKSPKGMQGYSLLPDQSANDPKWRKRRESNAHTPYSVIP